MAKKTIDTSEFKGDDFAAALDKAIKDMEAIGASRSPVIQSLFPHRDRIKGAIKAKVGSRKITQLLVDSGLKVSETSVKKFITDYVMPDIRSEKDKSQTDDSEDVIRKKTKKIKARDSSKTNVVAAYQADASRSFAQNQTHQRPLEADLSTGLHMSKDEKEMQYEAEERQAAAALNPIFPFSSDDT